MPLIKSTKKEAVGKNIEKEMEAGKPHKQSIAIALSVQRQAKKKKKMADGGFVQDVKADDKSGQEYAAKDGMGKKNAEGQVKAPSGARPKRPSGPIPTAQIKPMNINQGQIVAKFNKDGEYNDNWRIKDQEENDEGKDNAKGQHFADGGEVQDEDENKKRKSQLDFSDEEGMTIEEKADKDEDADNMADGGMVFEHEREMANKRGKLNADSDGGPSGRPIADMDGSEEHQADDYLNEMDDHDGEHNDLSIADVIMQKMADGGIIEPNNVEKGMKAIREAFEPKPKPEASPAPVNKAYGGEIMKELYDDEDEDAGNIDSLADQIMRKKYADGGMVDLEEESEEQPNYYDELNELAADEPQYDDDQLSAQPLDSNEDGDEYDSRDESDEHDMVDKIRQRIKMRRGY